MTHEAAAATPGVVMGSPFWVDTAILIIGYALIDSGNKHRTVIITAEGRVPAGHGSFVWLSMSNEIRYPINRRIALWN